jgi:hypothetical protein
MIDDHFEIRLSRDQALVLSDWLDRVMGTEAFDRVVDDPAVWSALYSIHGRLETSLSEIFMPDYSARLEAARRRLFRQNPGLTVDREQPSRRTMADTSGSQRQGDEDQDHDDQRAATDS